MKRYIDADMCIAKIKDMPVTYDSETVQRCIEVLSNAPTIDEVPQWIPCSERLPEYGDYRESMECLDGCVWYFTDKGLMGLGYYYYSTKEWSTLRDLKPDGKVIAWMPLPKPYEVEE